MKRRKRARPVERPAEVVSTSRRESVTRLVMALGVHLPDDLRWLRELTVGVHGRDRDLVEVLAVKPSPTVPEVLAEARLVAWRKRSDDLVVPAPGGAGHG